jgi:hypothetical protein
MAKKTYFCTGCSKTFSRKYNAERHNEIIHNQLAKIYNKETGWESNYKKTNNAYRAQQDSFLSQPSTSPSNTSTSSSNREHQNNSINISNPMTEPLKDFDPLNSSTSIYNKNEIEGPFKILGKMLPFMDELDSLLLKFNPANRIDVLSKVIISSLTSPNPVSVLKEYINFFKIVIGVEKASTIISQSQKISKDAAKLVLRSFISPASHSKNKFQQQQKNEKY